MSWRFIPNSLSNTVHIPLGLQLRASSKKKNPKCVGMNRRSSIRVDAITHRFEMATLFSVRVRRDSARTWDYAITNASVGVEKRVYLQKVAARSGSFPVRRSFLGPTASHFGAEGPRHRERDPAAFGQTFPARWHFLQPC